VHLDNFPLSLLLRVTTGERSRKDYSDVTTTFFESRWFRRMWVVLEYIQCDVVHLLSSDFHILVLTRMGLVHNQKRYVAII
jgi:hypothetical protein